ncbi:MAG: NADH-quinone oxidoreductase subunit M [Bryobacterales bacterium]|nr:NADH-quinone oxidoreductase subunit M [Bryobacterales bacterium]
MLSVVLLTPLLGFFVLLALPGNRPALVRWVANFFGLAGIAVFLPLVPAFQNSADFQFSQQFAWIPSIGVNFRIAMDGISFLMVGLTVVIGYLAILSSWNAITTRVKEYYANFLFLQFAMLGVFLARDLLLFFVFWELVLIPMYFIIAIWGGERRSYASMKFLIYTSVGSVLMLLSILALYAHHFQVAGFSSFDMDDLLAAPLGGVWGWFVFWGLFFGFAVKVPMFPFHTWLPDAHTEAPTAGSLVLASVLLKMGTYGFLRISLPMLPEVSRDAVIVGIVATLSIVAIIYGALVSLMQTDWKRLVAYSSVSHMGFCTLGIFAFNHSGIAGSVLQQINHGISTGMLFLIVGIVYERRHSRLIKEYSGLFKVMPVFAIVFLIAALSSMGMPMLNGFIGEFTILKGAFEVSLGWAFAVVLGIALGAAYLIWLFQRTMFGDVEEKNARMIDLSWREIAVFAPLVAAAFWIGLYPTPFFDVLNRPTAQIVEKVNPGYYEAAGIPNPLTHPSVTGTHPTTDNTAIAATR